MNLMCRLGYHRWVRVGITKPIRRQSDFTAGGYVGHFAMGRCEKCEALGLRRVTGYWEWYHSDEETMDKYKRRFDSGEYQL